MDESYAFYLATSETEDSIAQGTLVHAVVQADMEQSHGRAKVSVRVVPSLVSASFDKMHRQGRDQAGYFAGCNRQFQRDENIIARVVLIRASEGRNFSLELSVDTDAELWLQTFPVKDSDASFFLPLAGENWTKIKLGLVDASAKQKKQELKDWVRRPRNIRHLNWQAVDHAGSVAVIRQQPVGNVLFRPSWRHAILVAMLKVFDTEAESSDRKKFVRVCVEPEKCFRCFDVVERGNKTLTAGFEVAQELEVEGVVYRDFDEIIARHMDPIMDHLRLMMEHSRFGLDEGQVTDRYQIKDVLYRRSKQDRKMLYYSLLHNETLPGHGLVLWSVNGLKVREELIEVSPQGYAIWGTAFETIELLVQWFKTVGWRNSHNFRAEFKKVWEARKSEGEKRRGADAFEGKKAAKPFQGWQPETSYGGLHTPGGVASSNTPFGLESAAPTPGGSRTPAGTRTPAGNRTPTGSRTPRAADGTRTPIAFGRAQPTTPAALLRR